MTYCIGNFLLQVTFCEVTFHRDALFLPDMKVGEMVVNGCEADGCRI